MSRALIRRTTSADARAVVGLFRLWPGHERERVQYVLDDAHVHFVAEVDGVVVGYAKVTPDGWGLSHPRRIQSMGDNWGFMPDLLVSPDCRRRGIGAQLVSAVESVAWKVGAQGLAVSPDETGDRVSLLRFYERCGFTAVCPHGDDASGGWPYFFKAF